jgi:hypothetical protein
LNPGGRRDVVAHRFIGGTGDGAMNRFILNIGARRPLNPNHPINAFYFKATAAILLITFPEKEE